MDDAPHANKSFIVKYWQGEEKLWKAFWVVGVGLTVIIRTAIYLASTKGAPLIWWVTASAVVLVLQVWWAVSVWRCAHNASQKLWSQLARIMVIWLQNYDLLGALQSK
jgi:hypothetical protein